MTHVMSSVFALLASISVLLLGHGLFSTLLSLRMAEEGFSDFTTGLVQSAYFGGFIIGTLLCHRVIDRAGHIRSFATFATLASAAALVHAFVVTPEVWAILRAMTGFCVAGIFMITESWLNGKVDNAQRGSVLGFYMASCFLAIGAGQFLLGLADPLEFELFSVVAILFSLALVPILLTKSEAPPIPDTDRFGFRKLLRVSPVGLAVCFCAGTMNSAFYALAPIYARAIGFDASEIARFMGIAIFCGLALQWPMGWLSDRLDRRLVVAAISVATTLASVALIQSPSLGGLEVYFAVGVFGGFCFTLYGQGIAHANDKADPSDLIAVSAGLLLFYGMGAVSGPIGAAAVMSWLGSDSLFVFQAVIAGLVTLFTLIRMLVRAPVPLDEQNDFVLMPSTTPMAVELDPRGEDEQFDLDFEPPEALDEDALEWGEPAEG